MAVFHKAAAVALAKRFNEADPYLAGASLVWVLAAAGYYTKGTYLGPTADQMVSVAAQKWNNGDPSLPGLHAIESGAYLPYVPNAIAAAIAAFPKQRKQFKAAAKSTPGPYQTTPSQIGDSSGHPIKDLPGAVVHDIPGVHTIGEFLHALSKGETWIRVGEVVGGFLLIGVGTSHMLGIRVGK